MKKLTYLLIMPRTVTKVGEGYTYPLGIAYISAAMKEAGFNVFTLNLNHIEGDISEIIINEIKENKIDVIMTGGLSFQYNSLKRIVDCIHYRFPEVKIIIGGGIITSDPKTAMIALEYADFGIIGEGEVTIVDLCKTLENARAIAEVAGIVYMADGDWILTKTADEIMDLDSLPFPDYDGFGLEHYLELPPMSITNVKEKRSFFIVGSRSCPYQCTFCFHTTGKKYRQRSIENLVKEIELLAIKYNVKHIMFSDELFARNKEKVRIIENTVKKFGITWGAFFRVDDVNEELISIVKNGNCISMNLGLESVCNKILKSMRKNITFEQIDNALKLIYNAGIPTTGNFIFGDIEETLETAKETLDYWENHSEYNITLSFVSVYPGTYLYKYALQNGVIKDPIHFLKAGCPIINVSKLSENDFSYIAERIFNIGFQKVPIPQNSELLSYNTTGRITLKGNCVKCGSENVWDDSKILCGNNWINCNSCGQKHIPPFPKKLKDIFLCNIKIIEESSDKVGLWGVTRDTFRLFKENEIFKNSNLIFIDNAIIKQKIKIHGKNVYSPDILISNKIETVIFFYPNSYAMISDEVKQKYPNVKNFINVYDLLIEGDFIYV